MIGKVCNKCNVEKDLVYFHKCIGNSDGYHYSCKECRKLETKEYYKKNSTKLINKSQEYRMKYPKKVKDGLKNYRLKNLEKIKQIRIKWSESENGKKSKQKHYKSNSEIIKLKVKDYKKKNPEKEIERRTSEKYQKYMKNYGKKYSEEKLKKMSEAMKGKNLGKKISNEIIEKRKLNLLNNPEIKEKISNSLKAYHKNKKY